MFGRITPGWFRHVYIRANGQTALAFCWPEAPVAPHTLHAIKLITTRDGLIATVEHFMQQEMFGLFGAPLELRH